MEGDNRFSAPLYTVREAAWYLGMPRQTFRYWATQQGQWRPLVTAMFHGRRREATVPFIGFIEAFVVRAFRLHSDINLPYLRQVLNELDRAIGIEHALASKRLYVHGQEILYDFSRTRNKTRELAEVLTHNAVFEKVVQDHLRLIHYDPKDGWPRRVRLSFNGNDPVIEVNARRSFGQPIFIRGGARLEDVLNRLEAGEDPDVVAQDFHVQREDLVEIISGLTKRAKETA